MEVEFSFVGLDLPGWFPRLQDTLGAMEAGPSLVVDQLLPPPGTFGADRFAKVKASLASAATLATIIGAGASLYSAVIPRPAACEVFVQTGQVNTIMTYDCKDGNPAQVAEAVSKLVAESLVKHTERHGHPQRVVIRPIHGPRG